MSSSISLPDLLGMLPDDARAKILGGRFTRAHAGCRRACKALRELHDSSVAHAIIILSKFHATDWHHGRVRSPHIRLPGCHSLELRLEDEDCDRLISLAFVGATAADWQRITRIKVTCWEDYDMARIVEALAARLPALEELEFGGADVDLIMHAIRGGTAAHTQLALCTIADCFTRLRRLVLPLPGDIGLAGLAACAHLRDLTVSTAEGRGLVDLSPALLEDLPKLQQLESFTLGRFCLRAGDEHLLTQLLTTRRPPNLVTLKLLGLLEVDFEPAAGGGAQPDGRRGMRSVAIGCSASGGCAMQCADQLARAVLAAADQLQQLTVPELAVGSLALNQLWRPPRYVQPDDPLPRLVARCGRVKLGSLYGLEGAPHALGPAPVLAVVLLRAVDELAAEAARVGGNRCGGGAAIGAVVILRCPLPPIDEGSMERKAWMKGAVEHCVRLAVQEPVRQQPEKSRGAGGAPPIAGSPSSARELARGLELIDAPYYHVAAPAAGVLLLGCDAHQRAAELVALLSGAARESSVQQRGGTGSVRAVTAAVLRKHAGDTMAADTAMRSHILKVLTDTWARSQQGSGSGSGTSDGGAGGGGGGSSNRMVANEEALRQLLELDLGVRRLWVSERTADDSDSSSGADGDDGLFW
ncbi:hypothetical protein HXX76_003964 [Chlamydomonas incerta]|uniref:Uncharacterized protein n=1 Tax=Chlamydomonas incerta TaxID=51695 RepID=A0A835T903_CHLIN|nr:hypothetical protein HXX76_003964 [Chlamydomonas incerta]|eukprot:KAG2441112.1 hypothetical protein HXX76_003964 [Chlamydomonas incerta]